MSTHVGKSDAAATVLGWLCVPMMRILEWDLGRARPSDPTTTTSGTSITGTHVVLFLVCQRAERIWLWDPPPTETKCRLGNLGLITGPLLQPSLGAV